MKISHINPDELYKNPAFSQAITVENAQKVVYVGGQNGIMADGELAGKTVGEQSVQALKNVVTALEAAGATKEQTIKLSIYLVQGNDINEAFGAAQQVWGAYPTTVTVLFVAGLAHPEALVEIEAVAAAG